MERVRNHSGVDGAFAQLTTGESREIYWKAKKQESWVK